MNKDFIFTPKWLSDTYTIDDFTDCDRLCELIKSDFNINISIQDLLENEIIPLYYKSPSKWSKMVKAGMNDVLPFFDSGRMAREYYEQMYWPQEITAAKKAEKK